MRVGTFQTDTSRDPPLHTYTTGHRSSLHIFIHRALTPGATATLRSHPTPRHTPVITGAVNRRLPAADSICDHLFSRYCRGLCW